MNAVVTELALRSMLFPRCEVAIQAGGLRAAVWGEPVDAAESAGLARKVARLAPIVCSKG